ncbi:NAD(P)-dependent oxidoreductase [Bacillus mojavensis]|uniref:NAD(P)-dependent oxidoreductase n=1 Tax=Bacillus mojavensis TaxID=72360 RepID=UPI002DB7FD04|nr:NAD(P)-dependent oxidoreductase [Bacillus mojavensis]MEC1290665.1 NAD(P)-dependent oxidoreductase [Bacillus mojavensis]MEC1703827.1 NAD(P)-dependent oxidoreductase [Bacillus mojavensis]MEC1734963.1 NAD(P)-dependent oxidoreductase [Bacillus mojavensis]MEC5246452.1 NAD(P)-dependent oxidoreductase [Bacillus mojavensis]MED1007340.1 NAD(P)-dependent oxidoreductase [Bacillus mojavensis]
MKIGIIGASGKAGSLILKEAKERGHEVTAIVRNASKVQEQDTAILEKDVFELTAEDLKPFDALVNAFGAAPGQEHLHVEAGRTLISLLKDAKHTRLFVVGGAGSLFVDEAKTTRLMDTPEFPKEYLPTASNQGENLIDLQKADSISWTFLSPAAFFDAAGKRTGSYQKGKDNVIVNAKGDSYISYADFAIAVLDELEHPSHKNERFTVVSEAE